MNKEQLSNIARLTQISECSIMGVLEVEHKQCDYNIKSYQYFKTNRKYHFSINGFDIHITRTGKHLSCDLEEVVKLIGMSIDEYIELPKLIKSKIILSVISLCVQEFLKHQN